MAWIKVGGQNEQETIQAADDGQADTDSNHPDYRTRYLRENR